MGDCIVDDGFVLGWGSGWKMRQLWIKKSGEDLLALLGKGEILADDSFFIVRGGG